MRVRRLHDDSGGLCVVLNNHMSGSSRQKELFYRACDHHHRNRPKIIRKEMTRKEEPPGHLPQYAHRPPKNIRESHRYRISFRRYDKHMHGEVMIWQLKTTRNPQTPKEIVWHTKPTGVRPGTPSPPQINVLQPNSRGDALNHWLFPNVPHGIYIRR